MRVFLLVVAAVGFGAGTGAAFAGDEAPKVDLMKVPDGGVQPRLVADQKGGVHLVYFKGDPAWGDVFYTRLQPDGAAFQPAVRVNSQLGSAIAMGTIRGPQLALGREGRVHVAWNGSGKAEPKNSFGSTPMLYSRSVDGGRCFEPQRNAMARTSALDGGGAVAADADGNVYVSWHASDEEAEAGEAHRRMWVAVSRDDGATFSPEAAVLEEETGACGCCGSTALADRRGTLYLFYRAATHGDGRDMHLLRSPDKGRRFADAMLHPWKLNACPMSSASLVDGRTSVYAAWETNAQVYFAMIDRETGRRSEVCSPPGGRGRKHPAVADDGRGLVLLAWAEGTGWQRGGSLAWRVFDEDLKPSGAEGRLEGGVPTWSFPAAASKGDGSFLIVH